MDIDVFNGPLDLLLRLIEREELDITAISVARVAENYLQHVRQLQSVQAGDLAEFVALAARLLLIKSRALLPRPPSVLPDGSVGDEDAEELAAQLRRYQAFRLAADVLRGREQLGLRAHARPVAPQPMAELVAEVSDDVERLLLALRQRANRRGAAEPAAQTLELAPRITVRDMVQRIVGLLLIGSCRFTELLSTQAQREEVAVAFWAMLELNRRAIIHVEQSAAFGPLTLHPLALHLAPQAEVSL